MTRSVAAVVLLAFATAAPAREGDNRTPGSTVATAFESYLFQSPDNGWPDFLGALSAQGYVVQRFKNESFDNDPEGATIANFVGAGDSGVLAVLHIHGNTSGLSLEVYKNTNARDAAWNAYLAAGYNPGGEVEIAKSDFSSGEYSFRNIRMQTAGMWNRIRPQTDPLDALVYAGGVCNSNGFVDYLGGRVRFSNDGVPNFWFRNLAEWFALMSGTAALGQQRPAGSALESGNYDAVVRLGGDGRTTLCPTVLSRAPVGEVESPGGRVPGRVEFDTEVSAEFPLEQMVLVSGATIEQIAWDEPGYAIGFEIGGIRDGETVHMRLPAEQVRSAGNGARLDGNQVPLGSDGKRPNGDDYFWSFSGIVDGDGDGLRDSTDDCPAVSNPDQGPVPFVEPLLASETDMLSWTTPADVTWVRGDLSAVATYAVEESGDLTGAMAIDLAPHTPAPGAASYYLVKHRGTCGIWSSGTAVDSARDLSLP